MSKQDKNKVIALCVTIAVHAIVVLLLVKMALRTPLPLPGEAGVEVNLGMYKEGMGVEQPKKPTKVVETPKPKPQTNKQETVTQDTEETPAVDNKEPKKEEPPKIDKRALFPPIKAEEQPTSEGKTENPGDQGNENGEENSDNTEGNGTNEVDYDYDLGGRSPIGTLPKPNNEYLTQKGDKICIQIKVNSKGEVIDASYKSKGSTLPNISENQPAINSAINAAKKSRWKMKKDDTGILIGTITYFII